MQKRSADVGQNHKCFHRLTKEQQGLIDLPLMLFALSKLETCSQQPGT